MVKKIAERIWCDEFDDKKHYCSNYFDLNVNKY